MITVEGKCEWSKLSALYHMECIGEVDSCDAKLAISTIIDTTKEVDRDEMHTMFCDYLNIDVKILHRLLSTRLIQHIDIRRFLACKELLVSADFAYPQAVRYEIVAIKFGFSANTVRRFFDRYPQYFEGTTLLKFI